MVTCDIPGTFLQSDWLDDNYCCIKFEGIMVKMLCEIDPSYKSKVVYTKDGQIKFLYGKLEKVVYRTILGAILFYNKMSSQLENWGFKKNPHGEFIWNKTVDGEQLTVQEHVDDLLASHKDQCVLDNFIEALNNKFGKGKKFKEKKGAVHDYLALTVDFSLPGKVIFSMFNCLEDIVVEAPLDLKMGRKHKTPASWKLFTVNKDLPLMYMEKVELFLFAFI